MQRYFNKRGALRGHLSCYLSDDLFYMKSHLRSFSDCNRVQEFQQHHKKVITQLTVMCNTTKILVSTVSCLSFARGGKDVVVAIAFALDSEGGGANRHQPNTSFPERLAHFPCNPMLFQLNYSRCISISQ